MVSDLRIPFHFVWFRLCFFVLLCLVIQLCLRDPMDCSPPRLPHPWRFFRQEYWNGLLYPPPGDLPNPGIEPKSPSLQADSLLSEPQGKPSNDTVLSVTWYYEKRTGLEIRTKFLSRIKHYVTLNILLKPWTVFSSKKIRRYIGQSLKYFQDLQFPVNQIRGNTESFLPSRVISEQHQDLHLGTTKSQFKWIQRRNGRRKKYLVLHRFPSVVMLEGSQETRGSHEGNKNKADISVLMSSVRHEHLPMGLALGGPTEGSQMRNHK